MKTAVLISGHMRSFERCLPTLHWHVFRHFVPSSEKREARSEHACDFFVSTEPDEDAHKADLLFARYAHAENGGDVYLDTTPQPTEELKDLAARWEAHAAHAPYAISVPAWQVLAQLWRLERCWQFLFEANPRAALCHTPPDTCNVLSDKPAPVDCNVLSYNLPGYDLVIRCRPDLWMESIRMPSLQPSAFSLSAFVPWWGRFGGVNDRFALLGRAAAHAYFTTYSQIPALLAAGCPLHPESLVKASLEAAGCQIDDTLDVSFSTLRSNGELRFPEIMLQDMR